MDLPPEIDRYIKESIDDSLGLPVSEHTLRLKLRASEDANRRLHNRYLLLLDRFNQSKAEANMNAVALKKFVEENQRLAAECASLVKECSLYEHDREALMDFGNEADARANQAELRANEAELKVHELEHVLEKLSQEELQRGTSSAKSKDIEHSLIESILNTLVSKEDTELGHAFLETNSRYESCQELLKMWNSLRPSSQRVLSLAAKVNILQKDKENLRVNLTKAEEEVKLLSEDNNILDVENKRLLKQQHRDQNLDGSGGKHSNSVSSKGHKRKSTGKMSGSPVAMKIDSKHIDLLRHPLSPLAHNSPECRKHEK